MTPLYPIRRLYNRLRKQVRRWRSESQPYRQGLPDGIHPEILQTIMLDHFGCRADRFFHKHLSAWKPSGAYRLLLRASGGKELTLVYKDARYIPEQIPALIGLPVRPGPPEYLIYSQPTASLAPFLPRVYLAEEVSPQTHYRYLLEDLAPAYERIRDHQSLIHSAALLPDLHAALQEWSAETGGDGLITYGIEFSRSLQVYARNSLQAFHQHVQHSAIDAVLDSWTDIQRLHLLPEFFQDQPGALIHGDTNFTNIHLHKQDPGCFKVVDWEWAGVATPYADLASLLKGTPEEVEKTAFESFSRAPIRAAALTQSVMDNQSNYRLYLWCKMERGLIDAAFLASQYLSTDYTTKFNLQNAVFHALSRVHSAYQQLSQ